MRAFVINLDAATDRWSGVLDTFRSTIFTVVRVPAVDGKKLTLPIPEYAEWAFHRKHGRRTNLCEVGCYLSHLRACRAFLKSDDEFALVCEDDITFREGAESAIGKLLSYARQWDIVRLSGLGVERGARAVNLWGEYYLSVSFKRQKGAGAYLINRSAARVITEDFLPMKVPFDHAIDREWFYGLKACRVIPYPVSQQQRGYRSSIQIGSSVKLSRRRRWLTTYPYQVFTEMTRPINRARILVQLLCHRIFASGIVKPTGESQTCRGGINGGIKGNVVD